MMKVMTFDHNLFRLSIIDTFVSADLDRLAHEYLNDKKGGDFQSTVAVETYVVWWKENGSAKYYESERSVI